MYQTTFSAQKPVRKPFRGLILGFLIAITLLYGTSVFAGVPFSDNFDSYSTGLLEGQGSWQHLDSSGNWTVVDSGCRSGKCAYDNGSGHRIDKLGTYQTSGSWSFWINNNSSQQFEILLLGSWEVWDIGCGEIFTNKSGKMSIYDMAGGFPIVDFDDAISDEWFMLTIEWDFTTMKYRAKINDNEFSSWYNIYDQCDSSGFRGVRFRNGSSFVYVDDIGDAGLPPEASVWGIDPESGTEITDLDTVLTVGYEGLDDYDSLYIALKHPQTGISTDAKQYDISELEGGEIEINLQDFNITKNGNWHLYAISAYEGYQYEGGMFLSGYGWNWTEDLTDGEYYLDINIEGFEPIFEMSDFNSWYSENSKFDEPTDMFSAIANFFSPIFSTIGEFGSRVEDYFDVNSSYSKGYEIGKAIPIFTYYVGQISYFMGGFPLMNWLLIVILILVGIFIIRIIFKFIPFLGGS